MNRISILIIFCFLPILVFAQTPANDPHWQLKWEDQFNSFDENRWARGNYVVHGSKNVMYLKDQVYVSNGNLVIAVSKNPIECPTNPLFSPYICDSCTPGKTYNYRSGWVQTFAEYSTQFGYIEARFKCSWRKGLQYAFWTFSHAPTNSNSAEIDIIETTGKFKTSSEFTTCLHTCYKDTDPKCIKPDLARDHAFSNFSFSDYHTYAIEWDANRIVWYLDGKAIRTSKNAQLDNYNHSIIDPVILNFNVGIRGDNINNSGFTTEFMQIDYVKVYSLKCDKNTVVTQIPNFNTYDYAVKKSISLGSNTTMPAGSNITLRATDFIELKPGFEVQIGRQLYLDVSPCSDSGIILKPDDPNRN